MMYEYRNKAVDMLPDDLSEELRGALIAYVDFVVERSK